jgi:hypothetical protein
MKKREASKSVLAIEFGREAESRLRNEWRKDKLFLNFALSCRTFFRLLQIFFVINGLNQQKTGVFF